MMLRLSPKTHCNEVPLGRMKSKANLTSTEFLNEHFFVANNSVVSLFELKIK